MHGRNGANLALLGAVCALSTASAAPAAAAPRPPIATSWYIGESIPSPDSETNRFDLGPSPSMLIIVAGSRILPNVLVELAEDSSSPLHPSVRYAAGTQLFQLAGRRQATFCTFRPVRGTRHHCFVDGDGDGSPETATTARAMLAAPPMLALDAEAAPLAQPLALRDLPREASTEPLRMSLIYYGRRRMTRRDATFWVSVSNGMPNGFSQSRHIRLYLDELPPTANLGGIQIAGLTRNGNRIQFEVASSFPEGPFEVRIGGPRGISWGF